MKAGGPGLLQPLPDVLADLGATPGGLSTDQAAERLARHGPNELTAHRGPSFLSALVRQLVHPLALLLWLAPSSWPSRSCW